MAITIGTARYAAAATACRFLSVLLVADWRWRLPAKLLAASSLAFVTGTGVA